MQKRFGKKTAIGLVAVGVLAALGVGAVSVFGMGHRGPPQVDMRIDQATRSAVIEQIAANLEKHYVFPDKGNDLAARLRARGQQGKYAAISSAEKFADTLTDDLQGDSKDKHLEVRYFEKPVAETKDGEPSAEEQAEELETQRWLNGGIEHVQRFHGNLGYIDVHAFARPALAQARWAAAMTLLADTKALIIDLRECGGGDPDTVMIAASYLFDKRTHLNDLYWRDPNITDERWTSEKTDGTRYGEARKIYVLTSSDTASGCEDLAYALKNAGRAKLVGETTAGAAHAGGPRRLGEHFMMFVPSGRPINPMTHTDWEGVGVTPDVDTSAKKALDRARILVLKDLLAVETFDIAKHRLQTSLDELE